MDFSDITAIICEFDPFHHGHKHLINKAKEKHGAVVCIMSGNFVQRGECALFDKYYRAKAAVNCGADLVLSLPFPYSMMSARDFAFAGVHIAAKLKIPYLTFGAESDENALYTLADSVVSDEAERFIFDEIKKRPNASFAKLRQKYAEAVCGKEMADALSFPNNILAVEYIGAIRKNRYDIKPEPVERDVSFLSSSTIRAKGDPLSYIPKESADALKDSPIFDKAKFSSFAIASLRNKTADKDHYEASGGLDGRILKYAPVCNSLEELENKCAAASFTRSKCRRAILSMILEIPADIDKSPGFTQVICANEKGKEFLAYCRKNVDFPVVTKLSAVSDADICDDITKEVKAENVIGVFYDKPLPHPLTRTPTLF